MPRRHAKETILVRWTIHESLWREFMRSMSASGSRAPSDFVTLTPPEPFPASGIEVIIRDDALFVGDSCVRGLLPYRGVSIDGPRLKVALPSDDGDGRFYLLPIVPSVRAEVTRVVERFIAADREAALLIEAEDAKPNLPNRLAKWVQASGAIKWIERHFVLASLVFFFGVIPLFVFCLHLLWD